MGKSASRLRPVALVLGGLFLTGATTNTNGQQVSLGGLSDVAFGTVDNFSADLTNSQSICVSSTAASGQYQVTATGNGQGGAFTLASGSNLLAYEIQWAASPGQASGTSLRAGVTLTGQAATPAQSNCSGSSSVPTASLITLIRSSQVSAATAGQYAGTLTLLIAPN